MRTIRSMRHRVFVGSLVLSLIVANLAGVLPRGLAIASSGHQRPCGTLVTLRPLSGYPTTVGVDHSIYLDVNLTLSVFDAVSRINPPLVFEVVDASNPALIVHSYEVTPYKVYYTTPYEGHFLYEQEFSTPLANKKSEKYIVTAYTTTNNNRCGHNGVIRSNSIPITFLYENSPGADPVVQARYGRASRNWGYASLAAAGTGIALGIKGGSITVCGLTVAFGPLGTAVAIVGLGFGAVSYYYSGLSYDPPDPNFQVIARPVMHQVPHVQAGHGITAAEASATNALLDNIAHMYPYSHAMLTSIDRASGAVNARNQIWERRQLQAAANYAAALVPLLSAQPGLYGRVRSALSAANVHIAVTRRDIQSVEQHLLTKGLPPYMEQYYRALGMDRTTILLYRGWWMHAVPQLAPGTFPDNLPTVEELQSVTAAAVTALNAFVTRNARTPPALPPTATPTVALPPTATPTVALPPDLTGSWQSPSAPTCPPWSLTASGQGLNTVRASWQGCGVHAGLVGSFQGTLSLQNGAFVYTGTFQVSEGGVSASGPMSFTIVSQNEFLLSYQQSNGTSATNQVLTRVGSPSTSSVPAYLPPRFNPALRAPWGHKLLDAGTRPAAVVNTVPARSALPAPTTRLDAAPSESADAGPAAPVAASCNKPAATATPSGPPVVTLTVNGKSTTSVQGGDHAIAVPPGSAVSLAASTTYLPKGWKLRIWVSGGGAGSRFAPGCSPQPKTTCTATLTYVGNPAEVTTWSVTRITAGIGPPGLPLGGELDINAQVGANASVFWCNATDTEPVCTKPIW